MDDYLTELARVVGAPPPRHVPYWLVRAAAPYIATFMGRARVPMSNARIADELGWRPRYPTYREALALLECLGRSAAEAPAQGQDVGHVALGLGQHPDAPHRRQPLVVAGGRQWRGRRWSRAAGGRGTAIRP